MKRSAILLLALILLVPTVALSGGLSKSEMKKLKASSMEQLSKSDFASLGETLRAIAADDSKSAVSWIAKVLGKCKGDGSAFQGAETGLNTMKSSAAKKEFRKQMKSAKDWQVRVLFMNLLRSSDDKDDIKAMVKAIDDKNPVAATTAIRILAAKRCEDAVEPMISRMEKLDSSRAPPWAELRFTLADLLGQELDAGADYRSMWATLKDNGGLSAVKEEDRERVASGGGAPKGGTVVRLFGSEIVCTRIVFILDVSGSMKTIDPSDEDDSAPMGSSARGEPEQDPKKPDRRWRIERAKRELKRVVKALPASSQINIIAYSDVVRLWKAEGLHKLNEKNKTDAVAFVDQFVARGVTATDSALERAFTVDGARCFYLLSDGKPSMGPGDDIPPQTIYDLVKERNKLLKVRIFTLGFRGADRTFMRELAKQTGGRYSDIK